MIQLAMKDAVSVFVHNCEVVETLISIDEEGCDAIVWGLCVEFSDGKTVTISDICTRRADAEKLRQKLKGAFLSSDFLHDIVDDFLSELYGIHI